MADKTEEERRRRRLEKQRLRQRRLRAEKAKKRTPERDDFGRELLHFAITENLRLNREAKTLVIIDHLVERLVAKGFDRAETNRVIGEIIDRYEAGWSFQRKVRLAGSAETETS